jgi:hypothetical protein
MHYNTEYLMALENCIMDDLLPMYIVGCRSVGRDPGSNAILKKLLDARTLRGETPFLLKKPIS